MQQPTDYRAHPAISASDMNALEENPWLYNEAKCGRYDSSFSTEATEIGDIADLLLTKPAEVSENDIIKDFFVLNEWNATEKVKDVVDLYYAKCQEDKVPKNLVKSIFETDGNLLLTFVNEVNYQSNWKTETRINKIRESGSSYLEQLIEADGRPIIEGSYLQLVKDMIYAAEKDPNCGPIVNRLRTDKTALRQFPMYGPDEDGLTRKGLLDFGFMDDHSIQPYDVKTAKNPKGFMSNYFQSKYYRQAANYTSLLRLLFPGLVVLPFRLFVLFKDKVKVNGEHKLAFAPRLYQISNEDLQLGLYGGTTLAGNYIKGVYDMMREFKWHIDNNQWDYPYDTYLNNGIATIHGFKTGTTEEALDLAPADLGY